MGTFEGVGIRDRLAILKRMKDSGDYEEADAVLGWIETREKCPCLHGCKHNLFLQTKGHMHEVACPDHGLLMDSGR